MNCNKILSVSVFELCVRTGTLQMKIWSIQNGENERKRQRELDQQRAASQMAELKMAKQELEQEVDTHKKRLRLHMEAQVRTQINTWEC